MYISRMQDPRLPKRLLYGKLQQRNRSRGGEKKRFKDTLKISLKAFGIYPDSWELIAEDWCSSIHKGATTCEANRTAAAEQRRRARKVGARGPLSDIPAVDCHPLPCTPSGSLEHELALSVVCLPTDKNSLLNKTLCCVHARAVSKTAS